jgi:hypothetical protein
MPDPTRVSRPEAVRDATVDEIRNVLRDRLHSDGEVTVCVGPRSIQGKVVAVMTGTVIVRESSFGVDHHRHIPLHRIDLLSFPVNESTPPQQFTREGHQS